MLQNVDGEELVPVHMNPKRKASALKIIVDAGPPPTSRDVLERKAHPAREKYSLYPGRVYYLPRRVADAYIHAGALIEGPPPGDESASLDTEIRALREDNKQLHAENMELHAKLDKLLSLVAPEGAADAIAEKVAEEAAKRLGKKASRKHPMRLTQVKGLSYFQNSPRKIRVRRGESLVTDAETGLLLRARGTFLEDPPITLHKIVSNRDTTVKYGGRTFKFKRLEPITMPFCWAAGFFGGKDLGRFS